ncbi:hypothetical protein D3C81_1525200 [compost metagenome]
MYRFAGRGKPFQHLDIEFGKRAARINDKDQGRQLFAALYIVAQQFLPVQFGRAGHFGIAVAGQVDQQGADFVNLGFVFAVLANMGATDGKIIDMLCAAGGFGRKSQFFLVAQDIDRG